MKKFFIILIVLVVLLVVAVLIAVYFNVDSKIIKNIIEILPPALTPEPQYIGKTIQEDGTELFYLYTNQNFNNDNPEVSLLSIGSVNGLFFNTEASAEERKIKEVYKRNNNIYVSMDDTNAFGKRKLYVKLNGITKLV